jgi:NAD(P)-dependent dehydrogenase (short-subunit alcohol dehydrogenase family)
LQINPTGPDLKKVSMTRTPRDIPAQARSYDPPRRAERQCRNVDVRRVAVVHPGGSHFKLLLELWQRVMSVDLNGPMLMSKAFLPLMQGRGWGRIINVSSATVATASPVSIAYRTAKMGVIGFTRALLATLGDDGITVNAVPPRSRARR